MDESVVEPAIPAVTSGAFELDDDFGGLACSQGLMTICGFGSLLSKTSALTTFPSLQNFRTGLLRGWRRVFTHQVQSAGGRGRLRVPLRLCRCWHPSCLKHPSRYPRLASHLPPHSHPSSPSTPTTRRRLP